MHIQRSYEQVKISLLRLPRYATSPPQQGTVLRHPLAAATDKMAVFQKRRILSSNKRDAYQEQYQTSELMVP